MPPVDPRVLESLIRQMDEQLKLLLLVTGALKDGTRHYAYVSMQLSRYPAFRQAEAAGNYNLAEFGEIVAHGEGNAPPASVKSEIEAAYAATHLFEPQLQDLLGAAQLRGNPG